jgi:AcrR family transcriptional regulator
MYHFVDMWSINDRPYVHGPRAMFRIICDDRAPSWRLEVMAATSRKDEYSAATRRALLRTARKLFASRGYSATSIADIAEGARVTSGALYHHFRDKKEIFQAIVEEIEQEIMEKADAAAALHRDPWDRLLVAIEAMLDASMAVDVQRIGFVDAPVVLGPVVAREIETRYGYGRLQKSLERLIDAGLVRPHSLDLLGPILLGCLHEAATAVGRADDVPVARQRASQILRELFSGLRTE